MKYKKYSLEEVINNINNKYGKDRFTVLSDTYLNNKTPLKIKCNICGLEREISYNKLMTDSICPGCSKKKHKTTDEFKTEVYKKYNDEYDVLGEYVNTSTKILFRHNLCNNEFMMSPSNFLGGHKCPHCSHGSIKYTFDTFYNNKFNLNKDKFELLEIYCDGKNECKVKCKKCGNIMRRTMYYTSTHRLLCDECETLDSLPEIQIKEYLNSKGVQYSREIIIEELSSYHSYPRFDFKINNDYFIEYDGLQHFEDALIWGSKASDVHEKDLSKNNYINNNNLLLFRIKYNCWRPELSQTEKIKSIFENIIFKCSTTKGIVFISDGKIVSEDEYYQEFQAKRNEHIPE